MRFIAFESHFFYIRITIFKMKYKVIFLIVLFGYLGALAQSSNKIHFKNISVKEGLSFPTVTCILQDKHGFIWVGTEVGLNKYDSQRFKSFHTSPVDSSSLSSDNITCLFEDSNQHLLIGTNAGLNTYNRSNSSFIKFSDKELNSKKIVSISENTKKEIWVLTSDYLIQLNDKLRVINKYSLSSFTKEAEITNWGSAKFDPKDKLWISTNNGVRCFDPVSKQMLNPLADNSQTKVTTLDFYSNLYFDSKGNLWVGIRGNGVKYYSFSEQKWILINGVSSKYINGIYEDIDNNIWICTGRNGLNYYNTKTKQIEVIKFADMPESNLVSNSLSCIYGDAMGGIWIGTFNNGLLYYYQHQLKFNLYYSKSQLGGMSSNYITAFATDKKNNIWIGAGEEGLIYYNRNGKKFEKVTPKLSGFSSAADLKENFYILSLNLTSDEKHLLIGTLTGLFDYEILTNKWRFFGTQNKSNRLIGGYTNSIISDKGKAYIGTMNGFSVLNISNQSIQNYKLPTRQLANLVQDSNFVYIASRNSGMWRMSKKDQKIEKIDTKAIDIPSRIRCLYLDKSNRIVLGTDQLGIFRVNRNFNKIEKISNVLNNERIVFMGICGDSKSGYWATTNRGLIKISNNFKIEKVFDVYDGFNPTYFTQNSLKQSENEILVGGNAGFYSFSSTNFFTSKTSNYNIHLIDFLVLNKSVVGKDVEGFNLPGELDDVKSIRLPTYQNLITFEYTTLDYQNPSNGEFAYKLEPYDNDWNIVGNRRYATYRDLPSGTYKFKVKYQPNNSRESSEITEIEVVIPAIWWQSWWANLIYLLVIGIIIHEFYKYRTNRRKLNQELLMQKYQHEKMEELYNFKIDFFTKVTHELRTPLTLIISPLEEIIKRSKKPSDRNLFNIIHRNAQKLLLTVNQILDFRKLENSDMKVFAKKGNIVSFVEEILYSFLHVADKKGIELIFETNMEKYPFVLFDKNIIEKIIVNLVSNAVKFTNKGYVKIKIFEKDDVKISPNFFIEISDTGQGIKPENLNNIFETFFQEKRASNNSIGSGIGLKIVKELTQLHKGFIEVDSVYEKGSTFTLSFPKADLDLVNEEPIRPNVSIEVEGEKVDNSLVNDSENQKATKILLVDDEPDVLQFLEEIFDQEYQVFTSENPKKAIDIAKAEMPDLIISDVMMPEMDGFELCGFVKSDFLLGHIPVILLTALNATEHEIEGLKIGADAYISKPFSVNLLKATAQNLVANRNKLKQAFLNSSLNDAQELTQNDADKVFIEKVIGLIDQKIDKTDLEIADISNDFGMSQSTFYRKLKSLTDLSGNEFIRTIRLKRALELLKNTAMNISEIAYRVGFSDPKYFSTCFRKFYHVTPKEFIAQHRKDKDHIHIE